MIEEKKVSKVNLKYTKSFGYLLTFIFLIIFIYSIYDKSEVYLWAAFLSITSIIITLFFTRLLIWPALVWLKLGKLLHIFISPIILFIVYFFSIIITGLLLKVFGKDPLEKNFSSDKKSYWIVKKSHIKMKDLFNQY